MSTVSVFEGFQVYSNQSKRVSVDQLSKQLPQLFLKKDSNRVATFECSKQFPLDSLIDGKMFNPLPLKEYLINYLKKVDDDDSILDMAKSLIERIVRNKEEKNFERLLDFALVFMDCCAERIKGNISNEIIVALQELSKELEILLSKIESSKKNSAETLFISKMVPTAPLTDYYIERIELKKL